MKQRRSEICVICGKRGAVSDDHIPPRSIFPKPWPSDLLSVPACAQCNMHSSGLDEEFKVFIGMTVGYHLSGGNTLRPTTLRTLKHKRRLRRSLLSTLRDVTFVSEDGLTQGEACAVHLRARPYQAVVERTIRGLHWLTTGFIPGSEVKASVNWHPVLSNAIFRMTNGWNTRVAAGDNLIIKSAISSEDRRASAWVIQFFAKTWASGTLTPTDWESDNGIDATA